ncbi:unnamed protein product [Callosobruchus maculatus]|uniref:Uncharacterized protein n=1 Tax=Callosobruchus maculatus TaxID=64391 RepID=A0A653DMA7_CALMS|nr:unnamed protein product [Callosobruchus maculatus]
MRKSRKDYYAYLRRYQLHLHQRQKTTMKVCQGDNLEILDYDTNSEDDFQLPKTTKLRCHSKSNTSALPHR